MKKIVYALMLVLGMGIMVCSCQKDNGEGGSSKSLEGTWDCISRVIVYEDGDTTKEGDEGDYVVITNNTITFFYGDYGEDEGVPYQYTYDGSVFNIAGFSLWKITSLTKDTMVWESTTPATAFMPHETKTYKKRK